MIHMLFLKMKRMYSLNLRKKKSRDVGFTKKSPPFTRYLTYIGVGQGRNSIYPPRRILDQSEH